MIKFYEFVEKKGLVTDKGVLDKITALEESISKDTFAQVCNDVYQLVFNESPDPAIFTGHKFFKTKVVMNTFTREDLMRKGLQVYRMIFARHAEKIRLPGNPEFDTTGVVKFENFLNEEHSKQVLEEIKKFPLIENIQPQNTVLGNVNKEQTPGIYRMIYESDLYNICVQATHRRPEDSAAREHFLRSSYIQRLKNDPGMNDIQKVCHSDVFFPCLKYWYFPEGVTLEQGPFNFALNSVELTYEVLEFWYEESIKIVTDTWDTRRNKGHAEGSLRAFPADLDKMGYKLTPITVPPNTLIIGNTSGWHARGDAKVSSIRNAVHGAIRVESPFDTY